MMAQHGGAAATTGNIGLKPRNGTPNEAVAVPSRDASPSNFRRTFALQAARGLGVSYSEGKADPSHEA